MGLPEPDLAASQHAELAAFLRARRAELKPQDVGLEPSPGRRNTPGLRREEVTQISGVGVTWYTWLEQGRPIAASAQVIDALARAFRLDRETHRHLRRLAGLSVPETDQLPDEATPELRRLLASLMPAPASLFGPRFDYVAWNEAHARLWNFEHYPAGQRNVIWVTFMDPALRRMLVGWENGARYLLAHFRAAAGQHAGDERFAELIELLQASSAEFRAWWPEYAVGETFAGPIALKHPTAGLLRLDVTELHVAAHPSLTLNVQLPVRRTDREKLITLLANAKHS
jgi:hypothetical protein